MANSNKRRRKETLDFVIIHHQERSLKLLGVVTQYESSYFITIKANKNEQKFMDIKIWFLK